MKQAVPVIFLHRRDSIKGGCVMTTDELAIARDTFHDKKPSVLVRIGLRRHDFRTQQMVQAYSIVSSVHFGAAHEL